MGEQLQKGCKSTKANRKQPVLLLKILKEGISCLLFNGFFQNLYATICHGFEKLFIANN
jgi:hypothetical protein